MLDLVTDNQYNFGTGAWYYSTQDSCSTARSAATTDSADDWFNEYLSNCVGLGSSWSTSESGRETYWKAAKTAFNLS